MIKQFLLTIPVMFAIACASTPVKPEPAPVPAPANVWDGKSPQEVCVDAAVAVCMKVAQCEGDVDGCANALGAYCTKVTEVNDVKTVYELCIPQVTDATCQDQLPQACVDMFVTVGE
jgi:hypothetical protein